MTKIKVSDDWWTTPTESESGRRVIVTGRRGMEAAMASGKYNERVDVAWRYGHTPDGMPDAPTAALIGAVSDALAEAFSKSQTSLMTGIYTGDGERDWVFYTKNILQFQTTLNDALNDFDLLPLEISAEKDPGWLEYKEMKELTEITEGD